MNSEFNSSTRLKKRQRFRTSEYSELVDLHNISGE